MEKSKSKKQKTGAAKDNGTANGNAGASSSKASMPATYPALDKTKTFDERMDVLADDVIVDCKPFEVESGFDCYIDENVQKNEWKAVWQSHKLGWDFLVEVMDVSFPHAKVELVEPFCCMPNSFGDFNSAGGDGHQQLKTKDEVTKYLSDKNGKVLLLELLPVLDESGDLDGQAEVLELYRYFYTYIWHATDENDDGDYYFAMYLLHPRMKIYYDVQKKKASKALVDSYTKIMTEYQTKNWQFKVKQEEQEEGEDDNKGLQKLWLEICKLENKLEKLTYKNNKGK